MAVVAVLGMIADDEAPRVYINPGHGGHTANDRNVVVPGFAPGDTAGFWESNSNLKKGFALMEMLNKKGYTTFISRVGNDEEDDLPLSTIVALCNQSGADVFYAIHSNATGYGDYYNVNFPMGIYRGYTGEPQVPGSDSLAACLGPQLIANKSTVWSDPTYRITGDWTFYPSWGKQGLGVLRGNNAVSMLNEGSFHDYFPETYRLLNNDYCWVEGWNFSIGADRYFNRLDNYGYGIVTGNIRDDRLLRTVYYSTLGADKRISLNGAIAKLMNEQGEVVQTCVTDSLQNGIYLFKFVAPGTYTIEASSPTHVMTVKEVEVKANATTYCNFDLQRVRDTAPEVTSYSPVWNEGDEPVACNEPVVLNFNWDMDTPSTEAAFSISPAVDGQFTWEDANYRLVFTPTDAYDTDTEYTVTLGKSAQHGGGTPMVNDFTMKFKTMSRNHIYPLAVFPYEGAQAHYKAGLAIEFRTDSLLDAHNLFSYFHVYDKAGNELAYNKRNIKNNKKGDKYGYCRLSLLKPLQVGEDYRLVVDKMLCDTVGLHLTDSLTYHFTAVDAGVAKEGVVVEDFEDESKFVIELPTHDGAPEVNLKNSAADKLFGDKSLQLDYTFHDWTTEEDAHGSDDWYSSHIPISIKEPSETTFTQGDAIGIHICGDMSYNTLEAVFIPTDNEHGEERKSLELSKVDYHGWHYATVQLDTILEAGRNYRLTEIRLSKNSSRMGYSGSLKFDNLLKLAGSGIADQRRDNSTVSIAPNPASDYVVASADAFIEKVELLNANGQLVAQTASNYINVSDIPSGVYLLKVHVSGTVTTRKVMVIH